MTKKQKTIIAIEKLIKKYEHPQGQRFFSSTSCPLCDVHNTINNSYCRKCRGCPLANINGLSGCNEFRTYRDASIIYFRIIGSGDTILFPLDKETPKEFFERAKFFKELLPVIKLLDKKYFTIRGWEHLWSLVTSNISIED